MKSSTLKRPVTIASRTKSSNSSLDPGVGKICEFAIEVVVVVVVEEERC